MILRLLVLSLIHFSFLGISTVAIAQPQESKSPQWLIVTTHELSSAIEPLKDRRKQQGYVVKELVRRDSSPVNEWSYLSIQRWISEQRDKHEGPTYVLLVGNWNAVNKDAFLPSGEGKHGRMTGTPTDHGYGLPDKDSVPTIAVGRIPARSIDELDQYVGKIARFEDQLAGQWTNRVNLWVGHPGGNSAIEKRLGEMIIQSAVNKSLSRLHLMWSGNCLIDFPNTPYSVDRDTFRERMKRDLIAGHCFTIYAGHSAPQGVWSEDQFVFDRNEWEKIQIQSSPGVILTTGCFACQVFGSGGEGFLTAAMRNPTGPAACVGAFAESYAAHGQLALDAFVELASLSSPPNRLGDYWLPMQQGIGRGKMDPLTFWLYDQADGSRGKVPLAAQRMEHLEMWTLLGDPAMKIPFVVPTIEVAVEGMIGSTELTVEFDIPNEFANGQVELQIRKRGPGNSKANEPRRFTADATQFKQTLSLQEPISEGQLVARAMLIKDGKAVLGTKSITLKSVK